jgi:hypothetical protein
LTFSRTVSANAIACVRVIDKSKAIDTCFIVVIGLPYHAGTGPQAGKYR